MTENEDESTFAEPRDIRDSHHDPEGEMGVSSERVGPAGPGQVSTDGLRDTSPAGGPKDRADADVPPEQAPGHPEENPEGLTPKAGYSSKDPRSD